MIGWMLLVLSGTGVLHWIVDQAKLRECARRLGEVRTEMDHRSREDGEP